MVHSPAIIGLLSSPLTPTIPFCNAHDSNAWLNGDKIIPYGDWLTIFILCLNGR
jgi:hypothetical protein